MVSTTPAARNTGGHSFFKNPSLNAAGIVYTSFITCYTAFILYSMYMLWLHRHNPAVRVRGFSITIAAIIGIHVYLAALFIVYPLNSYYKCGTEFWYMSIIFPLGIAIFQAANVKLMAVSSQQRELADLTCAWAEKKEPFAWSVGSLRRKFGQFDYVKKTYVAIGLGILLQVYSLERRLPMYLISCIVYRNCRPLLRLKTFQSQHRMVRRACEP